MAIQLPVPIGTPALGASTKAPQRPVVTKEMIEASKRAEEEMIRQAMEMSL
jgi:hypothetical protein